MATTKITSPDLFDLGSLNTALKLPSGTTAERPTSPSTGEWRYNTTTNLVEFWDGGEWRDLQSEDIPPTPSEHFNVVLYTGTGSAQSITGVGFKPDWIWIKDRDTNFSHAVTDSTRGVGNIVKPNTTDAQSTDAQTITSFDADGFSLGTAGGSFNNNGDNYVAWCWKANGGTTSSNTDGTITSTVQVNNKAGFSIVQYTAAAAGSSGTIGHGLSQAPEMIITKRTDAISAWRVGLEALGNWDRYLGLSQNNAYSTSSTIYSAAPTSSVYSIGNDPSMINDTIAYCFHSVDGFSKFGSYTGNGTTQSINTGFEPAFLIVKSSSQTGDWFIFDNKRSPSNPRDNRLKANLADAESTSSNQVNFLTNGFYFGSTAFNDSGRTFIYMAFASDPSTAPVLADSFANKLWTGNGSARDINVGFSPSWTWIKSRSFARNNYLYDILRGPNNQIISNDTGAQANLTGRLTAFNTDGFSLGTDSEVNNNAETYVAWSWKANRIPTINTDGTIQSVVSANQAAGFSIVSFTTPATNNFTVGHGLSDAPKLMIIKGLSIVSSWTVYSSEIGATNYLQLNNTNGSTASSLPFNDTAPTSSVFTLGSSTVWYGTNENYIAYCFSEVAGFSKFGSYAGNASLNTITTGFQPNFILLHNITLNTEYWITQDSARGGANALFPNVPDAEYNDTNINLTFTSTGFTLNNSFDGWNDTGFTYVYAAFKENPTPVVPVGYMAYLVVAGGGGGGVGYLYSNASGGGGAGGLRTSFGSTSGGGASAESNLTLAAGTYTITIGAGGQGAFRASTPPLIRQFNGNDSSITGNASITSTAGGYGGAGGQDGGTGNYSGATGGSGGGGSGIGSGAAGTANQGFAGASSRGGGGGASAAGSGANGGNGLSVEITGSAATYAGGGGAGGQGSGGGGSAGTGGGGAGGQNSGSTKTGTANTGGGGGGGQGGSGASGSGTGWYGGGAGGSGVVVLRMRTSDYSGTTTGSPTITTRGEETILTYTGSGTYVHS